MNTKYSAQTARRRFLQASALVMVGTLASDARADSMHTQPDSETYTDLLDAMDGEGTESDPYAVTDPDELQAIEGDLAGHYELAGDIDATDTETWNDGAGFTPIGDGNSETTFTGRLDGRGHTISGVLIDREDEYVGVFSAVAGSIEDVHLTNAAVFGDSNVGGLCGLLDGGTIEASSVEGTVAGDVQGRGNGSNVGGLLGTNAGGTVSQSSASADVAGEGRYVGGLVGHNTGTIAESFATGGVSGTDRIRTQDLGGLVGHTREEVRDCYSTGTVHRDTEEAGGLAGTNTGTIRTSYATGQAASGLVGNNTSTDPEVVDSYWDTDTSDATGSDGGEGLSTDEMQGDTARDTMDGFDFDTVWSTTTGYPILAWEDDGGDAESATDDAEGWDTESTTNDDGGLTTGESLGIIGAIGAGLYFWSNRGDDSGDE